MIALVNVALVGALIYLDTQRNTSVQAQACNLSAFEYDGSLYLRDECSGSDTIERLPELTEYTP